MGYDRIELDSFGGGSFMAAVLVVTNVSTTYHDDNLVGRYRTAMMMTSSVRPLFKHASHVGGTKGVSNPSLYPIRSATRYEPHG